MRLEPLAGCATSTSWQNVSCAPIVCPSGRAVARVVDEHAVRAGHAAVTEVEELPPVRAGWSTSAWWSGMERDRIELVRGVLGHVGEVHAGVGGQQHRRGRSSGRTGDVVVLVVLVGARQVDRVGVPRPAARRRSCRTSTAGRSSRSWSSRACSRTLLLVRVDPAADARGRSGRAAHGVVARNGASDAAAADAHVHPRLAVPSCTTSNSARSVVAAAGPSGRMICSHVSRIAVRVERQMPRAKNEA